MKIKNYKNVLFNYKQNCFFSTLVAVWGILANQFGRKRKFAPHLTRHWNEV